MKNAIKRNVPAPDAYKISQSGIKSFRSELGSKGEDKFCGFIQQATWESIQVPDAKYELECQLIYPKKKYHKFYEQSEKEKENERIKPLKKDKSLSPGQYEEIKSF